MSLTYVRESSAENIENPVLIWHTIYEIQRQKYQEAFESDEILFVHTLKLVIYITRDKSLLFLVQRT